MPLVILLPNCDQLLRHSVPALLDYDLKQQAEMDCLPLKLLLPGCFITATGEEAIDRLLPVWEPHKECWEGFPCSRP